MTEEVGEEQWDKEHDCLEAMFISVRPGVEQDD